jgi:carboxypeptidase C (cathepsin A)
MRNIRYGLLLAAVTLGGVAIAWGQGGRSQAGRGNPAQQQTPAATTGGRGGRGAAPTAAAGGAGDFYNYNIAAASGQPVPEGKPAETQQKIAVNGQPLAYTTQTGYLPILNATTGQAEAHVFYTFYAKAPVAEGRGRPLVIFFGGAPGVSAAWQDLGGLGPKRAKPANEAGDTYEWADNPGTLLQKADLVFANPVGTGFSRPAQPSGGAAFWSTDGDIASLAGFVRGFLTRYGRQGAPLFLAGEDFGTGRVAGLANYFADHQVPVHGVILLSITPSADSVAGDAQFLTLLPSLVMTAWQHKKLSPELNSMSAEQIAGNARQFASREYLHALYKGDRMTEDERTKVVAGLSRLTGLSKPFLIANNLRVPVDRFGAELLRDQRRTLAASDGRVSGFTPQTGGGGRGGGGGGFFGVLPSPIDFNLSRLSPAFLTAYEAYLRNALAYTGDRDGVFYLNSGGVSGFTSTGNDDTSLANAFARNPGLRLFVGVNYYDLNSPFYAAEFTVAHLSVSPEVRARNITISHLESGQMPYVDSKALVKLHRDLANFVDQAASPAASK